MSEPELTNRYKLIQLLGEKCRMCPIVKPTELEIDHIYNDGDEERAKYGSAEIYRYYLNHPEKAFRRLQVLCKECHQEKTVKEFQAKFSSFNPYPPPTSEISRIQMFMDKMRELEGEFKKPVLDEDLSKALVQTGRFTPEEVRKFIYKLQRESSIYESKPRHLNRV